MKWGKVLLVQVSEISAGQSAPKETDFSNEGIPFIRAGHLEELISGKISLDDLPKVGLDNAKKNRLKLLKKGSLVFAKSGMSAMMNRVYQLESDSYYVGHLASVSPKQEILSKRYCYYFLKWFKTAKLIKDEAYPSIGLSDIEKVEIPLPPLSVQKRIAEILDAADALRRKDQELLNKYDELAQAIFIDMFGDPVKNEKGWEENKLGEVCNKITDGTHDTPERLTEGIKFITGKHIRPFSIDFENSDYVTEEVHSEIYRRCNPEFGDVLYTNIGVNYGTAAMNTANYEFSMKNVALLKHNRKFLTGRFLEFQLNDPFFKDRLKKLTGIGGAQQFLSLAQIKSIKVIVPEISLQKEFEGKINFLTKNIEKVNQLKSRSETLFNSLLQKAFTGELVN